MNKLKVSVSPHIHSGVTTQKIMLDVIIALLPAAVAGCIIFGIRSLFVMLTSVAAAVLAGCGRCGICDNHRKMHIRRHRTEFCKSCRYGKSIYDNSIFQNRCGDSDSERR